MNEKQLDLLVALRDSGMTWNEIAPKFPGNTPNACRKAYYRYVRRPKKTAPKVLILDIETAPMEVRVWGLFDQNIGLDSVLKHTAILSWSAKWRGSEEVMYSDNRNKRNPRDDKELVQKIASLMDEADIIIWHNGDGFDFGKLMYRFAVHGVQEPSPYKTIDTCKLAKSRFKFDSNKLSHLTKLFCKKHVKKDHKKFPGNELWNQCLAKNIEAWKEMEEYNKADVLSLEELYFDHLARFDKKAPNFSVYSNELKFRCNCGSDSFKILDKYHVTKKGKYELLQCKSCGKTHKSSQNLLSKEKKKESYT